MLRGLAYCGFKCHTLRVRQQIRPTVRAIELRETGVDEEKSDEKIQKERNSDGRPEEWTAKGERGEVDEYVD